jgi:predicted nucleic acid-binding Zn ribbon protein
VLEEHGLRRQVERHQELGPWSEIVGETLAGVTRVRGLDGETLVVEVRNSAWLMELNMLKEDFLERVNGRLGEASVERVVFVLAETT